MFGCEEMLLSRLEPTRIMIDGVCVRDVRDALGELAPSTHVGGFPPSPLRERTYSLPIPTPGGRMVELPVNFIPSDIGMPSRCREGEHSIIHERV